MHTTSKEHILLDLPCDCNDPLHRVQIVQWAWDDEDLWHLEVHAATGKLPWRKRLRNAWDVLRNRTVIYESIVLMPEDLGVLHEFLHNVTRR